MFRRVREPPPPARAPDPGGLPDPTPRFLEACARGDVDDVRSMLNNGYSMSQGDGSTGSEGVRAACATGSAELLAALLAGGLDINQPVATLGEGATVEYPITLAISSLADVTDAEFPVVKAMVTGGSDVNARRLHLQRTAGFCEHTPLSMAIDFQNLPLVSYLVENGADVHAQLRHTSGCVHRVPFDVAIATRNRPIISYLLRHGADVTYSRGVGYTPLHSAVHDLDLDLVRMLLEEGADPNADDKYGTPVMHYVFLRSPSPEVGKPLANPRKLAEICQFYISPGVVFAEEDRRAFQRSVCPSTLTSVIRVLLDAGADPNNETCEGLTAGHVVTCGDRAELYRLLLAHGWRLPATDCLEQTALHHLAAGNDIEAIRLLVDNGGDLTARDKAGRTALHHTAVEWSKPMVGRVYQNLCTTGALPDFTDAKIEVIRYMLDLGLDLNATDKKRGQTLLDRMCRHQLYAGVVRWLLGKPYVRLPVKTLCEQAAKFKTLTFRTLPVIIVDVIRAGANWKLTAVCMSRIFEFGQVILESAPWLLCHRACARDEAMVHSAISWQDGVVIPPGVADQLRGLATAHALPGLRGWCVYAVRSALQGAAPGRSILHAVDALPVPPTVKEHITLAHCAFPLPGL